MSRPKILIHGAIAVSEGLAARRDILIEDGRIAAISENIQPDGTVETVNGEGCIVTYGLADVHVHLREPGFSSKETIRSGTLAAAHGGFTTVCAMPNLNPAPDSPEHLAVEQELIRSQAVIDVRPYGAITVGRSGRTISDVEHLAGEVVGFSDDGCGVQSAETMFGAMKRIAAVGGIVAAHCEDESLLHGGYIHDGAYACRHGHAGICSKSEWAQVVRDIRLAAESGCRYHACHISTAESVELVREARMEGLEVSCETAPHYLTLTEDDLQEEGRFKMNPPLRSAADRNALIKGIQDGTIEVIATDHAPHTAEEKSRGLKGSAMGIVGLETAFPVIYTRLVRTGIISLGRMIELMCDNPRRIFRLGGALREGEAADIALFDISTPYRIDSREFLSKGRSTPFDGWEVFGRCLLTLKDGHKVWCDEEWIRSRNNRQATNNHI